MDLIFYKCKHCGNIAYKPYDAGAPLSCCDEVMEQLNPGTVDASLEKHVPHITQASGTVTIKIGSVEHPMEEKHYIQFIAATCGEHIIMKKLRPGDEPVLVFQGEGDITAYEYCNLHGLWKGEA